MKFVMTKRCEIAGSHYLDLDYDSPCKNIHGHNWIITVSVGGDMLNINGMLLDFKDIKNTVYQLDHKHINDVIQANPTAENIAVWIGAEIQRGIDDYWGGGHKFRPRVTAVEVQESEGNVACYQPILS